MQFLLVFLLVCVWCCYCHAQSLNLVAAVFTPFNDDGSIDVSLETIGQYASVLAKSGVNCAFTCGTNGESLSLTVTERKQVLEAWAKVIAARNFDLKIIGTERLWLFVFAPGQLWGCLILDFDDPLPLLLPLPLLPPPLLLLLLLLLFLLLLHLLLLLSTQPKPIWCVM
jgi:hypothetical protein